MNAEAQVATGRAAHYIKTLCRHFSHKVIAQYTETHGSVQFPFGNCEMEAQPDKLVLRVNAADAEQFARVKAVVGGHLEEFAYRGETIQVQWVDAS